MSDKSRAPVATWMTVFDFAVHFESKKTKEIKQIGTHCALAVRVFTVNS